MKSEKQMNEGKRNEEDMPQPPQSLQIPSSPDDRRRMPDDGCPTTDDR
jgi:hypothetical protein